MTVGQAFGACGRVLAKEGVSRVVCQGVDEEVSVKKKAITGILKLKFIVQIII